MRKLSDILGTLIALFLVFTLPALAGTADGRGFARKLGMHLAALAKDDGLSGVVLIAKDGKPILTKAWGFANAGVPNRTDTKFNLGSINKIFTQVAIGQLAAAGKLSLDDTVRKHLPDYPSPAADKRMVAEA